MAWCGWAIQAVPVSAGSLERRCRRTFRPTGDIVNGRVAEHGEPGAHDL